jgi:hypothetical protein
MVSLQHENQTEQVMRGNAAHGRKAALSPYSLARGAPRCIPKKPRRGAGRVAAMTERTPKGRPSGSKKRQRSPVSVMLTPEERAKIAADAETVGLSLGGYFRFLGMRMQTPRTQTSPARDAEALGKLAGQLGKIGSNLNQLTKLGNQGQIVPPSSLAACLAHVDELLEKLDEVFKDDY